MSTILDALRKIEREKHGAGGQIRARVLAGRPRPLSSTLPHRSLLWTAGLSFLLAGFVAGVWMARQEESPPEEGGAPLPHLSKEAKRRFPVPIVSENFEDAEQTVSTVTGETVQEEQGRVGSVAGPFLPEHPRVLSEPPPLQDSPFVSSPQVALRPSLVDATPQRFSEPAGEKADQKREVYQRRKDSRQHVSGTAGEERESILESGRERQVGEAGHSAQEWLIEADSGESNESADAYAPAPANSAVSFLQWSPESVRRKAFVRVGGSPLTLVREGDAIGDYTVVEIRPDAVALRSGTTRFQIHVR